MRVKETHMKIQEHRKRKLFTVLNIINENDLIFITETMFDKYVYNE